VRIGAGQMREALGESRFRRQRFAASRGLPRSIPRSFRPASPCVSVKTTDGLANRIPPPSAGTWHSRR